jgi:hypothetical protein
LETNFRMYRRSMFHADKHVLQDGESVLSFIGADYGKLENYKAAGILIVTDTRLLYVHKDKKSQFKESWKFNRINGITESGFPLKRHEFQIEVGKSKKVFHGVFKKGMYSSFIRTLQNKINNPDSAVTVKKDNKNKYTLLEQIAKLKEQGILTEDEFQEEKKKILNI